MLRVTVFGPESTGKTTLARHLSREFDALYMPEYGRAYTHALAIPEEAWKPEHLTQIAAQHIMLREDIEARGGTALIVEDTDVVKTAIWSDFLCQSRDLAFDWDGVDLPELYLLLTPETPFVQDSIRMHDRQARREDFFERCKAELDRRGATYRLIGGSDFDDRTAQAEGYVDALLEIAEDAMRDD